MKVKKSRVNRFTHIEQYYRISKPRASNVGYEELNIKLILSKRGKVHDHAVMKLFQLSPTFAAPNPDTKNTTVAFWAFAGQMGCG